METFSSLQLIMSLIGGGVSGALVSYYLDKIKRKQAEEEKKNNEKIDIRHAFFAEIWGNLINLENAIEERRLLHDIYYKTSLKDFHHRLSYEEINMVKSTYSEIEEFNESIRVLKTNFSESSANELRKEIPTLRSELIDTFERFAPDDLEGNISIIKGENIPLEGGQICGHHGIAPPEFFFKELNKYGARYITPFDVLDYNKIEKFKIIINPYGEDHFFIDEKDLIQRRMVDTIKRFIQSGGIWIHAGGYPFHQGINLKTGRSTSTGGTISQILDLIIKSGGRGTITTANTKGEYIIGNMDWQCIDSRILQNSQEVYSLVKSEKGELNIFSSINIGKGKFIHYGGMHVTPEEGEFAAKAVCKLIKYYGIPYVKKED